MCSLYRTAVMSQVTCNNHQLYLRQSQILTFQNHKRAQWQIVSFTESCPTSPEQQQAAYDRQLLILGSEHHLLTFPHHWILHAKQTHKQTQQLYFVQKMLKRRQF